MSRHPKTLVIPSWYPSVDQPTAGAFIHQQVVALGAVTDTAVLYVREAEKAAAPTVAVEDGVPVVRASLGMPPRAADVVGRARAVATNLYNKLNAHPRMGLAAYEALRAEWGDPDIVHVQALWPAAQIAREIKRRYGVPYVVTEHSEEYSAASERRLVRTPGVLPLLLRPLARGAARTIAVSRFLANRLVELGLATEPVVIPNVVPVMEPAPLSAALPHVIAHVSVMGPAKNIPMLLRAVDILRARRSDFLLRLVGEGEMRDELEGLADSLGLQGIVEFAGTVPAGRISEVFSAAAFTVISSSHETFSVVAAESLMCGRPVLSTCCGGPEEFVTPAVGRLVPVDDVGALADGLDWMLDHYAEFDPHALHEYACERFAPEVVARQILDVYREVLGG